MYMGKAKFFVEGVADKRFLEDYLDFLFAVRPESNDIISCTGWPSLGSEAVVNELRKNSDKGGVNLVIFDGDNNPTQRRLELGNNGKENKVSFRLFLLPDNSHPGALEELLIAVMNPVNKPVNDCWKRYENDLGKQSIPWKNPPSPTIPAKKTQIYAYLEALLGETRQEKKLIKEAERNYQNQNHWDLSTKGLEALCLFLKNNLTSS